MDNLSIHINVPCLHHNVVPDINGGIHFSAGEVWDDIQERLLCLDCMQYVTEAEVHSSQVNHDPNFNPIIPMEISHDHA